MHEIEDVVNFDEIDDLIAKYEREHGVTDVDEKKVSVICPICKKTGRIPIAKFIVDDFKTNGLVSFGVTPGMICDHAFIIKIDANLKPR